MSYMGVGRPTIALTSSDIADDAVTTAKINDDAVTDAKLANSINTEIAANTAKVTNATHTGDVTGATALTIANGAVTAAKIASGVLENPNVVINGGFDVWQRGVTFSSLSYYQDYADRWMGCLLYTSDAADE